MLVRSLRFWRSVAICSVLFVFLAFLPVSESEVMECRYDAREVHVTSAIDGVVVDVKVKVGDVVKAGDPLVVLESPQVTLDVATCLAELDAADADARLVSAGASEIELGPLRASVALERAKLAAARRGFDSAARASQVGESGAADGVAANAAHVADAQVGLSDVSAQLRDRQDGVRPEELEIAEARVQVVAARCQHLEDEAEGLVVRAPRAGTILSVLDDVGHPRGSLLAAATDVARIAIDDYAHVELDLPAYEAERWGLPGEVLDVRLGAVSTSTWAAIIVTVAPQASGSKVRVVARLLDRSAPHLVDASCFARFTSEQTPLYDRVMSTVAPLFVQSFWRAW